MVAPAVAAAGIGAVGSIIGGITGGKGAKKAAQAQAQAQQQQLAIQERARAENIALNQPYITRGNEAGGLIGGFLGLGDPAASQQALATFRGATGYQDLVREGLGAVNANAYARGMGDSGATLKALQERGSQLANSSAQQWLGNLGGLVSAGIGAAGNAAGVTQNYANNATNIIQANTNAQREAALAKGNAWNGALQNLTNLGAYASSYGFGGR